MKFGRMPLFAFSNAANEGFVLGRVMSRRIVMGGHRAERRIADIGEEVVVGYVAGADQLDPRLVKAALDELFHEDRALTGWHKYKHGVGRVVLHPLQERRKVRVLERSTDIFRICAALL